MDACTMSLVVYKEEQESLVAPFVASLLSLFGFIMLLFGSIPMLLGFTTGGIAAGSAAAGMQAAIGNVVAGSGFAAMQSFGATGFFNMLAGLGGVAAGPDCALSQTAKKTCQQMKTSPTSVATLAWWYTQKNRSHLLHLLSHLFSLFSVPLCFFSALSSQCYLDSSKEL
jgi:hypothetical protein